MSDASFFLYRDGVNALLLDYQWIEELLRVVISAYYEAVRRANPQGVKFRLDRSSLEKDSLGALIQKYSQFSPNDEFVTELKCLVGERNRCAHRSLVLSVEEQNDTDFLGREVTRMAELKERTKACVKRLHAEMMEFSRRFQEPLLATAERGANSQRQNGDI